MVIEMKVECGFENCNWKTMSGILDSIPASAHDSDVMSVNRALIGVSDELFCMGKLLDHLVKTHGIPPAIWER